MRFDLRKTKFTSSQFGSKLISAVSATITDYADNIAQERRKRLDLKLKRLAAVWQSFVQMKLKETVVPNINYDAKNYDGDYPAQNLTPWPAYRSGRLLRSIRKPNVTTSDTVTSGRIRQGMTAKFNIKMAGLFKVRKGKQIPDVRKTLDNWDFPDTKLMDWSRSSQRTLFLAMKEVISGGTIARDSNIAQDDVERIYHGVIARKYPWRK